MVLAPRNRSGSPPPASSARGSAAANLAPLRTVILSEAVMVRPPVVEGDHPPIGLDMRGPITYTWPVVVQANSKATRGADATGPDLVALLKGWASTGHGSLARRLAHALRHLVDAGVLPGGWRLTPERTLA